MSDQKAITPHNDSPRTVSQLTQEEWLILR